MEPQDYLHAMGIPVWISRDSAPSEDGVESGQQPEPSNQASSEAASELLQPEVVEGPLDWEQLQQRVSGCDQCEQLVENRTQPVFGVGNRSAKLMIIGEAPGAEEDQKGEPFVGRAGQLLNKMLLAIGYEREQVYIANILKCRPPNNRDPHQDEMAHCAAYLQRQIELIDPQLLLIVGRIAAHSLLQTHESVGKLRGRVHQLSNGRSAVITYHPAYLLRSPKEKRKSWNDLILAHQTLRSL